MRYNSYSLTMDIKLDDLPTPKLALLNTLYPKPEAPAVVNVTKDGFLEVENKVLD